MMNQAAMAGHYNGTFVALSVLIAILSAYAALDLAGRVFLSRTRIARAAWLGCGATTMGVGIWCMHYIGMLALRMEMPVLYDWPTVVLSMVAAIAASGVALWIVSRATMGWFASVLGSLTMGAGIAAMHYIGMAAMRMEGTVTYSRPLFAASVVLAVVIAFVALRLTFATRQVRAGFTWRKGFSALAMGLAIPVMHYTGMAAAHWHDGGLERTSHAIGISDLGAASLALVTVVMLCLVFVAVIIDRRFTLQEEELEGSEKRYRRIVATSFDAFIGISGEGRVTDWNAQAERTFGWSAEEAVGRTFSKLLLLEGSTAAGFEPANLVAALAQNGRVELEARHRDGRLFPVEMTLSPIDTGGKISFAAFVHDVTERKLAEQEMEKARTTAEDANRAKSEFLANMSHEIRTPLNGVIGMTDLALETELTAEQRDYMETVKLSADGLLGVINDILDFSKIEAGKVDLEDVRVDLRESIEATLKTLALRADEKGLELLCDVRGEVPEAIISDPVRLRQIVTNLVGNAIKFTEKGEIAVTVAAMGPAESPLLKITVADTGIGIAPEKLGRIFESFSQADTSTTRQYGGTGLGLTISRRLIEMMGGRLWVESRVGEGSQFHFELPLRKAADLGQPGKVSAVVERLVGVKVLIIDDNRTNRRILEGLLLRWGMNPVTASDGETALERMEEAVRSRSPFRLIVTDMHMPRMDGFMVVEEMRHKDEQFSPATVMMLSSGGHRGDAARCQELGIAAYLLKPVRQNELQEAICRALGEAIAEKAKPMITQQSLLAEKSPAEFLRILLAEDNEVNQKLAVRLLEKRGHTVDVVSNGRLAVEAVAAGAYDLVLMDVQMPEMDGLEATTLIRQRERREGDTHQPIVAMTALVMKGDKERCLEAKMDGYVSKPIRPAELDAVLEVYTSRKKSKTTAASGLHDEGRAAIDLDELLERVDGDVEFIAELTEVLRGDCPRKLAMLRTNLKEADAGGAKRTAHGLKGALANLAAGPAAAVAAEMEALAGAGNLSAAKDLLPVLELEMERALAALSAFAKEHTL